MNKINLLAASRERPERMADVFKKWMKNAHSPSSIKTIISLDTDDPTIDQYISILNPIAKKYNTDLDIIVNDNVCTVEAINSGKPHINGDIIIVFSDDTDCFDEWDKQIIEFAEPLSGIYIIKTSDAIGETLITMPIFSKEYLDYFAYIYHPSYSHMFCDTELTCIAHLLDCIVDGNKFVFKHLHYTQEHRECDNIDKKNQLTFYKGMNNFINRMSNNFNIKDEEIKGRIPDEILEWIQANKK